ncbi:hypothetical protein GGD55_003046 [Rhizobium giardinii]|jgi:hypothetical protein|uniref:Uncharacterized protein n=1 Tax=Rhizobium giardinii TaxID=56731 RepID=A0A7W8UBI4_9HYPH|nr:hypothetical protein [Rhizobium giardinii]
MSIVAVKVLSTVNAPYGTTLSAEQLASKISDPASALSFDPAVFSFFSEVDEKLQISFLDEMHVDPTIASELARKFSTLAGYPLPLARAAPLSCLECGLEQRRPGNPALQNAALSQQA